jgi:hypothetical protein
MISDLQMLKETQLGNLEMQVTISYPLTRLNWLNKRMPLFSFPAPWNAEINEKFTPSQPVYLKSRRKRLLANLNV